MLGSPPPGLKDHREKLEPGRGLCAGEPDPAEEADSSKDERKPNWSVPLGHLREGSGGWAVGWSGHVSSAILSGIRR